MPETARNRFDEDVFTYRVTKVGNVLMSWQGRIVTTLAGKNAVNLVARLETADRREAQHLLARATGHLDHGNERQLQSNLNLRPEVILAGGRRWFP